MEIEIARGIESSDVFVAIVTPLWLSQPEHREEVRYAKALGKPFALAIEEGVSFGDIFSGCNIVGITTLNRESLEEDERLTQWVRSIRDWVDKQKGEGHDGAEGRR